MQFGADTSVGQVGLIEGLLKHDAHGIGYLIDNGRRVEQRLIGKVMEDKLLGVGDAEVGVDTHLQFEVRRLNLHRFKESVVVQTGLLGTNQDGESLIEQDDDREGSAPSSILQDELLLLVVEFLGRGFSFRLGVLATEEGGDELPSTTQGIASGLCGMSQHVARMFFLEVVGTSADGGDGSSVAADIGGGAFGDNHTLHLTVGVKLCLADDAGHQSRLYVPVDATGCGLHILSGLWCLGFLNWGRRCSGHFGTTLCAELGARLQRGAALCTDRLLLGLLF